MICNECNVTRNSLQQIGITKLARKAEQISLKNQSKENRFRKMAIALFIFFSKKTCLRNFYDKNGWQSTYHYLIKLLFVNVMIYT